MKKKYIFSAVLCGVLATGANAQITVTRAHLVVTNQKVVQAYDSTSKPSLATTGPNKIWDFSNLQSNGVDTLTFGNADWYPGYQAFPNANMALKNSSDDSSVTFIRIDNTQLSVEGANDWSSQGGSQEFKQKILALPLSYNSAWQDSTVFTSDGEYVGQDPDGPGPSPKIDSARGAFKSKNDAKVNGWGTMKTPLGSYTSLMVSTTRTQTTSVELYFNGSWQKVPPILLLMFPEFKDSTTTEYNATWWTNDAAVGFPLVEYNYLPGEQTANEINWLKVKPQASGTDLISMNGMKVYPNPATSLLQVSAPAATSLRISDLMGKVVLNAQGNEQFKLDISSLRSGVYSVSVYNNDALIGTEKLIKK